MMDTLHTPTIIRESAPRHATRLQLESATRLSQSAALATAREFRAEAFEAADDLLRALRKFQALPTNRKQEMRDWLADTAGSAIDQLSNVAAAIDDDLIMADLDLSDPLDISELTAFWESVK